jgi:hypothetical protein
MYGNENYLGTELAQKIGSVYDIGHLEKNLSFEISLVYYFSLRTALWSYDKFSPENLKHIFTKIVNSDKDIEEFIHEHLTSIENYYHNVHRTIGTIY